MKKKLAVGAAIGVALLVLAHMHVVAQRYYPVVKIAMPDGLLYTALQDEIDERPACNQANERFLVPVKTACKDCRVLAARCERVSAGDAKPALLEDDSAYVVVAPGMRLGISGPEEAARANCDFLANDMLSRGYRNAACLAPRS